MDEQATQAMERARDAAEADGAGTFLERLAERVGARATVRAVFGEPIERGDVTVVPVARVRWGVGGGGGRGPVDQGGSGSGGGGGAAAEPVGYVVITNDGASFEPIVQPIRPSPGVILAVGLTAALLLRALARLAGR